MLRISPGRQRGAPRSMKIISPLSLSPERLCHNVIAREENERSNLIKSCKKRRLPRSLWSLAMTGGDYDTASERRGPARLND